MVSAEIPDEASDPELYAIIMRFNRHPENHLPISHGRCSKRGRCTWGFPKDIQETTTLNEHGRVLYRRRRDSDRWVVSYMPFLSRLLNCHVNVDICFTVNVFMYLYKYLFKGPDHTLFMIAIDEEVDEIRDYINARYLSASEAAWRIMEYTVTRKEPAVKTLAIHLPDLQIAQMYRQNSSESAATTLLRYFARPYDGIFEQLTYIQYFEKYCLYKYDPQNTEPLRGFDFLEKYSPAFPRFIVRKRMKGEVVARIQTVSPRTGDLYYLRVLLLHRPARSFSDLQNINGHHYSTFQEAATALGLFANQLEAELTLKEAVDSFSSPQQLRFLFCHLMLNIPMNTIGLFWQYLEPLSADYLDTYQSPQVATDYCLSDLSRFLRAQGARLVDFGLPGPQLQSSEALLEAEAFEHRQEELFWRYIENQQHFTDEQEAAYYQILEAIYGENPVSNCFFLEGKAGRGKSFEASTIIDRLRSEGQSVVVVGSTALSVTLYERGRTAHAAFGIPVIEVSFITLLCNDLQVIL